MLYKLASYEKSTFHIYRPNTKTEIMEYKRMRYLL